MSGIKPLFTSAPRIKIKINNGATSQEVAYAIGLNVNVNISLTPVQTIGRFSTASIEPTQYGIVTGTLQIVKLNTREQKLDPTHQLNGATYKVQAGTAATLGTESLGTSASASLGNNAVSSYAKLFAHLDPAQVLASETFDLDLWLKPSTGTEEELWFVIKDVRLSGRTANISLGQLVNEPVTFQGIWMTPDDDKGDDLFAPDYGNFTA